MITLLSDFGTTDAYVAELKGRLLALAPGVPLVDVSHALAPGDVRAAAYIAGRVWKQFPEGSVHLVVVDPGVGTDRKALAIAAHGHWFVGPDNGLFSMVMHDAAVRIVSLAAPAAAAPTFHGRDVFAPAAAALALGTPLEALGDPFVGTPVRLSTREPYHEGKVLIGEVIYVDRFGTLVTNFTPETLPDYATIEIEGVEVGRLRRTFGDVPTGGLVAYVGSGGEVEIAVRDGSAARRFGIGVGGKVRGRLG
ncbi:MAG TPA: SAM-dependent chlorinase/fluorinase [Gemmatimonadales bacterium]